MKSLITLFTLGALLAAPAMLEAKITRTVEKTFTVQPGGKLKVGTQGGNIHIETADIGEVRVVAKETIRASSDKEADELLQKLTLAMVQNDNDLVVEAKYEKQGLGFHMNNWPPVEVDFTVTLPTHFNLDLNTSGGDIMVASLKGNIRARTSGGDLKFERVDGDIDGRTSGGNVTLQEGTAHANLETSGGNIKIDRAGGPTEVSTSGGDIRIDSAAQLISAETSGGNVVATLTEPLRQDTVLSTSGGDIRVKVLKSAAFHLEAETSGGEVDAAGLTITIEKGGSGKTKLVGSVNGGGPKLRLSTSGGNVIVRTE